MKKKISVRWKSSKQPRKQRKYRHNAPLHLRKNMLSANLDKTLRSKYHKRSLPLRKGDEVKIMRGEFKGKIGNIAKINLRKLKVYIENIKKKNVQGREYDVPLDSSNLKILKLNLDDKMRRKAIERAEKKVK